MVHLVCAHALHLQQANGQRWDGGRTKKAGQLPAWEAHSLVCVAAARRRLCPCCAAAALAHTARSASPPSLPVPRARRCWRALAPCLLATPAPHRKRLRSCCARLWRRFTSWPPTSEAGASGSGEPMKRGGGVQRCAALLSLHTPPLPPVARCAAAAASSGASPRPSRRPSPLPRRCGVFVLVKLIKLGSPQEVVYLADQAGREAGGSRLGEAAAGMGRARCAGGRSRRQAGPLPGRACGVSSSDAHAACGGSARRQ